MGGIKVVVWGGYKGGGVGGIKVGVDIKVVVGGYKGGGVGVDLRWWLGV